MNRSLTVRPLVAALLTAGLLGAGASAAIADPEPRGDNATTQQVRPAQMPQVSAHAGKLTVRKWQEFRINGKTENVVPGTTVAVQQKQNGQWVTLPARTKVRKDGSYVLRVQLGVKGDNQLRMATAGTMSKPFTVTVR